MKRLLALMVAGMVVVAGPALAAENSQQDKMKACNTKAGDKKGDERKAFMSSCLKAAPPKAESKMAMCNKKTAGMEKDARAKAQSECMKAG
jgi:hypothetical protein